MVPDLRGVATPDLMGVATPVRVFDTISGVIPVTWFKVDDSFYDHPKVFDAPDCAVALWVRAGCWSARNLTDGFVPANMPARLCDDPDTAVRELIRRGLWSRTKDGYRFHDWADYQPTRESKQREREAAAERQRRRRQRQKAQANGESVTHMSRRDSRVSSAVSHGGSSPSPTRPDPTRSSSDEELIPQKASPSSVPRKRGTRIPDDFSATPAMVAWARDRCPHVDWRLETEKFVNYWRAKTGKDATKLDWEATWRNWMLNAAARTPATAASRPGPHRPYRNPIDMSVYEEGL